jgi:hypothetical protein
MSPGTSAGQIGQMRDRCIQCQTDVKGVNMSEEQLHDPLPPALDSMLLEFCRFDLQPLRAVQRHLNGGWLDKIRLEFDDESLLVEAEPDYDTITVRHISNNEDSTVDWLDASNSEPWSCFIGKPFGWGWLTINQQGYHDGVLLSFDGIEPGIILNVMASEIYEATVNPLIRTKLSSNENG